MNREDQRLHKVAHKQGLRAGFWNLVPREADWETEYQSSYKKGYEQGKADQAARTTRVEAMDSVTNKHAYAQGYEKGLKDLPWYGHAWDGEFRESYSRGYHKGCEDRAESEARRQRRQARKSQA